MNTMKFFTSPQTRTEYVVNILREQILTGEITGGMSLTQQSIAETFNVSRIPVREALLILQAEGLVSILPHKGATVIGLSLQKITELFELRCLLEVNLLKNAIPQLTQKKCDEAGQILIQFNLLLSQGESIDKWSEYNQKFHNTLYQSSNKPETLSLVESLNVKCDRYIRMQLVYTQRIEQAQEEHLQILKLCRDKNVDAACQLLYEHIVASGESIVKLLEKKSKPKEGIDEIKSAN